MAQTTGERFQLTPGELAAFDGFAEMLWSTRLATASGEWRVPFPHVSGGKFCLWIGGTASITRKQEYSDFREALISRLTKEV